MSEQQNLESQERIAHYNRICSEMQQQGYTANNGTISVLKANVMALVTAGPIALLCFILYLLKWNPIEFSFSILEPFLFLGLFFICIVVHELLHGVTWALFCKNKWKSIRFGVMWNYLTPYCHCKEPLAFAYYLIGGLMPLFVLGVLWFILAYIGGSTLLAMLSIINILCAGGDTTIALMLLKYRKACILDHPTECGFVAFTK
ncbi:DUF3267 domain-containing protein [Hydrogenoanaerobacterium sp.]|uniref:DUF3267 domain-containing protein n=1 Tax=Hydrogenoanaerobacterium sp. TaxID=2953763 RepID=UPI002896BDDA|nr:DUF3267 domain-containing protein [Hydrogenoanaerobacterium sp.]